MRLIIFSLNIWNLNLNYEKRMKRLDQYLEKTSPDIVCLQEVSIDPKSGRPQTSHLPRYANSAAQLYSSQGKWGEREEGLATFAKLPVVAFESFMLPDAPEDMQRRVQMLVLEHGNKKFIVANSHLAYHLDRDADRVKQCRVIEEHLTRAVKQYETDAIVLACDLNSTPLSTPVGVLLNSPLGLVDAFGSSGERKTKFTFSSESPFINPEFWPDRWIDYIFVSRPIRVLSKRFALDGNETGDFVSDHVALEVSFELDE